MILEEVFLKDLDGSLKRRSKTKQDQNLIFSRESKKNGELPASSSGSTSS
jgi:hypothetical protein